MLWRSALRADSAVVLALKSRPELASFAALTMLKQAGRVSGGCVLRTPTSRLRSASPQKSPPAGSACRAATVGVRMENTSKRAPAGITLRECVWVLIAEAQRFQRGRWHPAGPGGCDFWGDEQRRPGVGARSAPPQLTRRACLSVTSEASAASSRRDSRLSSAVQSVRSTDCPSMSARQARPGATCRARPADKHDANAPRTATGRKRSALHSSGEAVGAGKTDSGVDRRPDLRRHHLEHRIRRMQVVAPADDGLARIA